jgi:alanine racemase
MTFTPDTARAWVDVDLGALRANARTLAAVSGSRLLPMIKANGYGLGAVPVARALEPLDPWGYGVASVDEGASLRAEGISRPILVVSPLLPAAIDAHLAHDLRPTVGDPAALGAWCARTNRPFHLGVDTGMGRAGLRWDDAAGRAAAAALLESASGWEGIFTHFHSAETDAASVTTQWERLQQVIASLPRRPPLVHAANSAGALRGRAFAGDLIRPGIFLYGGDAGGPAPAVVATLRARVLAIRCIRAGDSVSYGATWRASRDTRVATLALGYADGFPRAADDGATRRGPRLIELGGGLAPVVGRVTMDMTMVDLGDTGAAPGDVATVYGGRVSLDQQAAAAGTISYELLTSLGARVPRRYGREG